MFELQNRKRVDRWYTSIYALFMECSNASWKSIAASPIGFQLKRGIRVNDCTACSSCRPTIATIPSCSFGERRPSLAVHIVRCARADGSARCSRDGPSDQSSL